MKRQRSFLLAAAVLVVGLAGCGGGGGGGAASTPVAPPTAGTSPTCTGTEAFSAVADATIVVGKAAGAVVAGCSGSLSNVQWTQTGGPAVTLMSATTQAISFEPPSPGTYTFTVNFRDAGGISQTANVSTTATAPSTPVNVLARVDQAVRKGGNVSLRAWPAAAAGETITWTQTAGPQVTLDTSDQNRVLFVAPDVSRDTALVFRVTRRTASGATDSDDVMVLVENYAQAPSDPAGTGPYVFSDTHVSRVYPYRASGPFAAALVRCTFDANLQYFGAGANTCPLATLPFLHQTTGGAVPTVSQIMDRVLVSHDWMGQSFESFLTTQAPDDLKRLFNGVTAIVIGAHVRPSYYYALTGAIYLDADNFWLTAEQRDVIDEAPDYRSDFDRELLYSSAWRYTSTANGTTQSIFVNFPATSRIARSPSYLMAEAGWLLYHELGHASDFLPPSERGRLGNDLSLSPWGFIGPMYSARTLPSDQLSATYPLQSQEMFGLAQVKYQGVTASSLQKTYTPDMVGGFFAGDRATDDYNYTTTREDVAMVFEEFMMFRNHGWRRDFAVTDKITSTTTGSSLIVRWGQRGRAGDVAVKPRTQFVVGQLAPWTLSADPNAVQNLPAPVAMRPGDSWTANLSLPAPLAGLAGIQSLRVPLDFENERAMLLRDVSRGLDAGTPNDRFLKRLGR
jgi:K319L-like, PKD domain